MVGQLWRARLAHVLRRRRSAGLRLMAVALVLSGSGWLGVTETAVGYGRFSSASAGYDISWPQCGLPYPGEHRVGVVGVNGGRPYTHNPCLHDEYNWALSQPQQKHVLSTPALYMNLAYGESRQGPRTCEKWDLSCQAYNYGSGAAASALVYARGVGAYTDVWWLDVETGNRWSDRVDLNATVVQGAIDRLRQGRGPGGDLLHSQAVGHHHRQRLPAQAAGLGAGRERRHRGAVLLPAGPRVRGWNRVAGAVPAR